MRNNPRRLPLLLACTLLGGCGYLPSWAGGESREEPKLEGTRQAVAPAAAELVPDAAAQALPLTLPAVQANSDWPQHTGPFTAQNSNLALAGDLTRSTSASAGDGDSFHHMLVPRPVTGDGRVYAMDAAGHLSAHASGDIGTVLWRSPGVSEEDEDDIIGGGLAFDGGVLYAASGRGLIAAYDAASGVETWRRNLHAPLRSAPRVAENRLFLVTLDNQAYALSAADGEVLWSHRGITETAGIMNSVSPTVADNAVIVPYSSGEVYALAVTDGKELWSESLSPGKHTQASALLSGIGGDPVVDGAVVISVSSGGMILVQSLAGGQRSWERPVGSLNTPWVTGDSLFVLSQTNTLVHFVKYTGQIRWATQLPRFENARDKRDPVILRGPVMVDGRLAVTASTGQLYLISAETGQILSTLAVAERIFTAPVVAGGQLLLVDQGATLHALR